MKNVLLILIGNLIVAFAVTCFIIPNDILSGGLAGIAVGLQPLFPWINTTVFISITTIILFIAGHFVLGKEFTKGTVLSTIFYPLELNLLSYVLKDITFTNNTILSSIYTGIFVGVGVGLVVRTGSSTGGVDILALLFRKIFHLPVHIGLMIIDASTVILGIATHSFEAAMIGLISVYITSVMIDKVVSFGGQKTKSVIIISKKYNEILDKITKELDRGATVLHGEGGYSRENKEVVLCVVENKQYPKLNQLVHEIDSKAFLVVQDAHEVKGNGFSYNHLHQNIDYKI